MLTEYVLHFQAQSSACSLQAELEKLRLAENASDVEEIQHLKVIGLPHSLMLGVEQDNKSHAQARLWAWFNHS